MTWKCRPIARKRQFVALVHMRNANCAENSPKRLARRCAAFQLQCIRNCHVSRGHVHVRYMLSSVRLSVVCNVRAPYTAWGAWHFRQCIYAVCYLDYLWPFDKNFTEIVPGNPSVGEGGRGGLNRRGVARYSDIGPLEVIRGSTTMRYIHVNSHYIPRLYLGNDTK